MRSSTMRNFARKKVSKDGGYQSLHYRGVYVMQEVALLRYMRGENLHRNLGVSCIEHAKTALVQTVLPATIATNPILVEVIHLPPPTNRTLQADQYNLKR